MFEGHYDVAEKFASDLYLSAPIVFGIGLGGGFVLGFLWLIGLKRGNQTGWSR